MWLAHWFNLVHARVDPERGEEGRRFGRPAGVGQIRGSDGHENNWSHRVPVKESRLERGLVTNVDLRAGGSLGHFPSPRFARCAGRITTIRPQHRLVSITPQTQREMAAYPGARVTPSRSLSPFAHRALASSRACGPAREIGRETVQRILTAVPGNTARPVTGQTSGRPAPDGRRAAVEDVRRGVLGEHARR
jgi:hypothetical protein